MTADSGRCDDHLSLALLRYFCRRGAGRTIGQSTHEWLVPVSEHGEPPSDERDLRLSDDAGLGHRDASRSGAIPLWIETIR
jgi:hypothetical protein